MNTPATYSTLPFSDSDMHETWDAVLWVMPGYVLPATTRRSLLGVALTPAELAVDAIEDWLFADVATSISALHYKV